MGSSAVKFFKKRREIELGDFHSLKSRGGERRVKIAVRIPLSNRPTGGTPDWVAREFEHVMKDESAFAKVSGSKMKLEGMSVDFFTTDKIANKMQTLNSCMLSRFVVERIGETEKAEVYLSFDLYAPCGKPIIGWAYDNQGATVFAEFDVTQATLTYGGESGGSSDEDEEEEEGAEDANGPNPAVHEPVTKGRGKSAAANDQ